MYMHGLRAGVWLVSFCSPTATSCKHLEAEGWARLRTELHEQQVFLSKVGAGAWVAGSHWRHPHLPEVDAGNMAELLLRG